LEGSFATATKRIQSAFEPPNKSSTAGLPFC
jgi:hypothetical protein